MNEKHDQMPTQTAAESQWLEPRAAAAIIGVTPAYIYDACQTGGLRHTRLGGKRNIRILRDWLNEWMDAHEESHA